ncbi:hypothetical protein RVM27_14220 [Halomonas sp. KM007]
MKNFEKQWLEIDQNELFEPEINNTKGITVKVMLSPSDVPSAVRYFTDEKHEKLIVEFKYLSSKEKTVLKRTLHGAELLLGKNSRKIYKVAFDTKDIIDNFSGEVKIEMIINAEKAAQESVDSNLNAANKDVIKKIFKSKYMQNLGMA